MGIKKNFSYNLILTLCGYIFPLITYPYVSRVMGVQNIGICNFTDSIINYFVLFSMLGIGTYGVREIARVNRDEEKKSIVFSNLIVVNFITTALSVAMLITCTYTISTLAEYKPFLLIGIAKLVFNMFLIEWFYQGIQNFRYITIRSILVKFIYVIAIFIFVQDSNDVILYFSLTILSTIINAIINCLYVRNFVKLKLDKITPKVFLIPIITFGYYRILTSMYTTFNTVFLGFISGDVEVGYFTTATKLYIIIMSVLSAFTTVMIPKVSELLHEKQTAKLQWIADQTLSIITIFSMPIIIYSQFCAADIIQLIAGPGYEGAVMPFRIVIFMLLVIGYEQILIQQFLLASTKNKPVLIVCTIGAIVGISLNLLITPLMGCIGSAISWGGSEIAVLVAGALFVKKNIGIQMPLRNMIINLVWSLLYILPIYCVYLFHLNMWMNLILSAIVLISVFIIINLWIHKNPLLIGFVNDVKKRL